MLGLVESGITCFTSSQLCFDGDGARNGQNQQAETYFLREEHLKPSNGPAETENLKILFHDLKWEKGPSINREIPMCHK